MILFFHWEKLSRCFESFFTIPFNKVVTIDRSIDLKPIHRAESRASSLFQFFQAVHTRIESAEWNLVHKMYRGEFNKL